MPATYEPIATTTLGSAAADVTFSSISGAYTDLIIVSNILRASTSDTRMQINGDTGNNYSYTFLGSNSSSSQSFRVTNAPQWDLGYATSAQPTTLITQIQNYSNTTTFKTAISRFNSTTGDLAAFASLWRNTAAITSVKFFQTAGNLSAGSTFTLYGIKAA
jgi:hypothetical protein